jgi:hypothetical protein
MRKTTSLIGQPDELIPIFSPYDQLYQDYFTLFLTYTDQKKRSWAWFEQELLPTINHEVMIDLGAGNGELLSHFVPLFQQCIAFALMITHFIGREYVKELQHFAWQYSHEQGVEVKVDSREAYVQSESLEEILRIAIFILNDVPSEILIEHRPTRQELADWIHQNFYHPEGYYRMSCLEDFVQYRHKK